MTEIDTPQIQVLAYFVVVIGSNRIQSYESEVEGWISTVHPNNTNAAD